MNNRVTSIALFNEKSLNKFKEKLSKIDEKLCKVPYREENREALDTLPYHFTFTVWDISEEEKAKSIISNVNFNEVTLKIVGVKIKESFNNSWNLYFEIERNDELYKLQKEIYNLAKIEKYNPEVFTPHITIHCDRNYDKLIQMQEILNKDFIPFEVSFSEIGLFEIYPAIRVV